MRGLAVILLLASLLSGCAHALGYAGQHPGRFSCKGKVAITVAIAGQANAAYSAGNLGSFSANGDCGEQFTIEQGVPGTGVSAVPAPAK